MVTASATPEVRHAPTVNTYGAPCSSPATSTVAFPNSSASASNRCRRASSSTSPLGIDRFHDVVAHVEVGVDVLHVVAVFEGVDEAEDLAGAVDVEGDADRGQEARLGGLVVVAGGLQGAADRDQVRGLGDDLEVVAEVVDLL